MRNFFYYRVPLWTDIVSSSLSFWLENKVPKILLIAAILFFGFFAAQLPILMSKVLPYLVPSIVAIASRSPDAPWLLFVWSYILFFSAMCLQHKNIAFNAALNLYKNFGVKWAP